MTLLLGSSGFPTDPPNGDKSEPEEEAGSFSQLVGPRFGMDVTLGVPFYVTQLESHSKRGQDDQSAGADEGLLPPIHRMEVLKWIYRGAELPFEAFLSAEIGVSVGPIGVSVPPVAVGESKSVEVIIVGSVQFRVASEEQKVGEVLPPTFSRYPQMPFHTGRESRLLPDAGEGKSLSDGLDEGGGQGNRPDHRPTKIAVGV